MPVGGPPTPVPSLPEIALTNLAQYLGNQMRTNLNTALASAPFANFCAAQEPPITPVPTNINRRDAIQILRYMEAEIKSQVDVGGF